MASKKIVMRIGTLLILVISGVLFLLLPSDALAQQRARRQRTPRPHIYAHIPDDDSIVAPIRPTALPEFSWDNAIVYFAFIDRFYNGDSANDASYGRGGSAEDIATFHGGDLLGLTQKLDEGYFTELGINTIWITSPLEQIHGWVAGAEGAFPHYAYHGYYHLDWTEIDANFGTKDDLRRFVDMARARNINIVFDIVMNHTGYNTIADSLEFNFGAWKDAPLSRDWQPSDGQNWLSFHDEIAYETRSPREEWQRWWGSDWVRTGITGYEGGGSDAYTELLAFLPDLKTESNTVVGLPPILITKQSQGKSAAQPYDDFTVRDYLIKWLSDWVEDYGISGFRVDTAKHVELEAWKELKESAVAAYARYKQKNNISTEASPAFWMTGEVFGQSVRKNDYYQNGFDSLINFRFQRDVLRALKHDNMHDELHRMFQQYADAINNDSSFNVLSYVSSHDTSLMIEIIGGNIERYQEILKIFYLLPGAIQLFYGDEVARRGIEVSVDPQQGTRTDMPWQQVENGTHTLSKKLLNFRNQNIAIAAGSHQPIAHDDALVFARTYFDLNSALVVITEPNRRVQIDIKDIQDAEGTGIIADSLRAYTGRIVSVNEQYYTVESDSDGLVLLSY